MTGVYGLSFEIVLVNSVFAAAFLVAKERRKRLLVAACVAAVILQAGQWLAPPPVAADHTAVLVQPNIPIQDGAMWTKEYFQDTLRDLTAMSLHPAGGRSRSAALRLDCVAGVARAVLHERSSVSRCRERVGEAIGHVGGGRIDWNHASHAQRRRKLADFQLRGPDQSAGRVGWALRQSHLVPFGEYLPFPQLFAFAGGLTKEVGEFQRGASRAPLDAGGERFGMFICYESIFPDEVRQGPQQGAQVLLNISNDGWYGDSGAWKQHLSRRKCVRSKMSGGCWRLQIPG